MTTKPHKTWLLFGGIGLLLLSTSVIIAYVYYARRLFKNEVAGNIILQPEDVRGLNFLLLWFGISLTLSLMLLLLTVVPLYF